MPIQVQSNVQTSHAQSPERTEDGTSEQFPSTERYHQKFVQAAVRPRELCGCSCQELADHAQACTGMATRFTQQACSPRKARRKPMGRCSQVQCYCSVDANVACLIRCCSPVPTNVASLHTCQDPHQKSQLGAARRHPRNIPHTLMNTVDAADAAQAGRHVLHCLQGPTDSASACTIVL